MQGTAQITLVAVAATSIFGFAVGHTEGHLQPQESVTAGDAWRDSRGDSWDEGRAAGAARSIVRHGKSGRPPPDLSGDTREGVASFYNLPGRTMANGAPMDPHGNNAASRTLPLGTVAKVTNIETGKSALITIQDRGPYVKGRIVDLSPATARKIGITVRQGIGRVAVTPIVVPLPDGSVKPGAAAREMAGVRNLG